MLMGRLRLVPRQLYCGWCRVNCTLSAMTLAANKRISRSLATIFPLQSRFGNCQQSRTGLLVQPGQISDIYVKHRRNVVHARQFVLNDHAC